MTRFSSRLLAATAALCLIAGAASAEDMHISYSGLDLSRPADAKLFRARVDAAAEKVCGETLAGVPANRWSWRRCNADVWAQVDAQLPTSARLAFTSAQRSAAAVAER